MPIYPRVSGRLGNIIDLNVTFYRNGVPSDPYAIRKVSIYRSSVQEENLITEILVSPPWAGDYPSPLTREESSGSTEPGIYHAYWEVPTALPTPDIYFDVWHFIPNNPGVPDSSSGVIATDGTDADELVIINDEDKWIKQCNQFWLYSDGFFIDTGLETIRLGFEAMDCKFHQPEVRTLEVGIMPQPLYDYDYNKVAPIIPFLKGYLTLYTDHLETLVDRAPMKIGLRQGTYKSNPFVMQYKFDTKTVLL